VEAVGREEKWEIFSFKYQGFFFTSPKIRWCSEQVSGKHVIC
jgi:hypothetical protein